MRWGDPLGGNMPQGLPDADRIAWHTTRTETCWLWTGTITTNGYGMVWRKGGPLTLAHRLSYEVHVGPIPEGLTLDHLCRVKHCVNPAHLEPVTNRENTLRGTSPVAINARKTACKWGHDYTPDNTYVDKRGRRSCQTCRRAAARRHRMTNTNN